MDSFLYSLVNEVRKQTQLNYAQSVISFKILWVNRFFLFFFFKQMHIKVYKQKYKIQIMF